MKAFGKGDRVRYTGMRGPGVKWDGRQGVVTETYRDYDGERASVLLDGETKAWSFDVESLEPVKETYEITNWAEDSTSAILELTDAEAAVVQRVIEALNADRPDYAPELTMEKK